MVSDDIDLSRAAREFLAAMEEMNARAPGNTRLILCEFRGNPQSDKPEAGDTEADRKRKKIIKARRWKPQVWRGIECVDQTANVYITVAAMKQNANGEFRRSEDGNFAAGLCLMIDDLGTGPGSRHSLEILCDLPPTALIETSPDNFQAIYIFSEPVTDMTLFKRLIQGFMMRKLLSREPGMDGANRVFRPGIGINGKPKYADADGRLWRVRVVLWCPANRYTIQQVAKAFQIPLRAPKPKPKPIKPLVGPGSEEMAARRELFGVALAVLIRSGTLDAFSSESLEAKATLDAIGSRKLDEVKEAVRKLLVSADKASDRYGWLQVRCPWINGGMVRGEDIPGHTDGDDSGSAIRMPTPGSPKALEKELQGNEGWGSFRCYHGHGKGKGEHNDIGWRDVLQEANGNGVLSRYDSMLDDTAMEQHLAPNREWALAAEVDEDELIRDAQTEPNSQNCTERNTIPLWSKNDG